MHLKLKYKNWEREKNEWIANTPFVSLFAFHTMNVNIKFVPWTKFGSIKKWVTKPHTQNTKYKTQPSDIIYVVERHSVEVHFWSETFGKWHTVLIRLHYIEPHPINFRRHSLAIATTSLSKLKKKKIMMKKTTWNTKTAMYTNRESLNGHV